VPVNWSAYEDIADFFTNDVKQVDGKAIFGHMDYGKKAPDLGWRFTDDWLGMAGEGDVGVPNGYPVDEWGIRMEGCRPVGASVKPRRRRQRPRRAVRAAQVPGVAAQVRPPRGAGMDFLPIAAQPRQGQRRPADLLVLRLHRNMVEPKSKGNNTVDANDKPLWRMAPTPHGPYWKEGMKAGYRDEGSWTLLKNVPVERTKAAWLYAQFVTSKTVDLRSRTSA